MSRFECPDPIDDAAPASPDVVQVIVPRARDLGGFEVRRVLPAVTLNAIGPFVFLDQMGPATFAVGRGLDVRPHPHIGLATLTYLYAGQMVHRDSLGTVQTITPGAVNWMRAGSGIVHSERSDPADRAAGHGLHGLQLWVALPRAQEEITPAFEHHGADALPVLDSAGVRLRVAVGEYAGRRAPATTLSPMQFVDAQLASGARWGIPADLPERGVYVVSGAVQIGAESFTAGRLLVLKPGAVVAVSAQEESRLALIGGAPLDGPRTLWWNFVSSRPERIAQAQQDWRERRFAVAVPGETEFIPLPD